MALKSRLSFPQSIPARWRLVWFGAFAAAMLAADPDQALLMTRMDSRKRIAALTRIQMSETAKPAAPAPRANVSKVPPPKPVVDAVSDDMGETDLTNDKLDDRTWSKLWDKKYRKTG